ncbi:uncharacterized protein LOC110892919 [Helianthus annuus]|uniref:uncharacterized protein LOC110892919 n=1 Tax=Helianthus annuus TaxID=4232 RepID=UPI000B904FC4|nr:uncharacterized protein LOC110892919 [Helianthus annuus]
MERVDESNLADRSKLNENERDVHDRGKPLILNKGFTNRVFKIDGNTRLPRRGIVQNIQSEPKKINVIDELIKITEPVLDANLGQGMSATDETGNKGADVTKPRSYADSVKNQNVQQVNFRSLACSVQHEDCDIVLPVESVRVVQDKLANTLYGYFLGDRIAYPVVDYFVKINWKKFGLQKSMMNANGFFFFKFEDQKGMLDALAAGPWIIRSQPFFLQEWTPTTKLEKKEVKKVQVWVKVHEVPIAAYTEDGLSMIATAIGEPKMLDSYTTSMCVDNWVRTSFARALIEVTAEKELKEKITMAIPNLSGDGFMKETMYVEYEWNPLRCSSCCVFGHSNESCPKNPKPAIQKGGKLQANQGRPQTKSTPRVDDDGYMGVHNKKVARKTGINIPKPKPKFEYRPISNSRKADLKLKSVSPIFQSSNPFDVLNSVEADEGQSSKQHNGDGFDDSDDEEVIEIYNETNDFLVGESSKPSDIKGASTPSPMVTDVFRNWEWTSNGGHCDKGTRIIIGWDPDVFDIIVLAQTSQVIHVQMMIKSDKKVIFCSIVYASNFYITRRELWSHLARHKILVDNNPWVLMGDFNSALNLEDKSMGSSGISTSMQEFQECVNHLQVADIKSIGFHFTWTQKPKKGVGLLKKIDRAMSNIQFVSDYPEAVAMFQPYRVSDHCPCILRINKTNNWDLTISGVHQFRLVKKLRALKSPLRSLLFKQGNLHKKVEELRGKLDAIQRDVERDPFNENARREEVTATRAFQEACLDEERFLKQKSKVAWLRAGDANSKFFHLSLKSRNHRTRIEGITDINGIFCDGQAVPEAFVNYYETFLGSEGDISSVLSPEMFQNRLSQNVADNMIRSITVDEIKSAIFAIGNDKAPGPDGYTAAFFKRSWDIVGTDVTNAVMDFFISGRLLQEINHTLIVLLPKMTTPTTVKDFRPIACCNVIYKCISKILSDRLKVALNDIVSINQSAFVPGRKISDNILLTQELMHNYHKDYGPPRCAFKVDIQKAYDTVDWNFLEDVLLGFGFNQMMIKWIMLCVATPSYSGYQGQDGSFQRGKTKVSWNSICKPKYEGGLGLRRLQDVNKALMVSHIWSIITKRDSLWVQWIYSNRIRNTNFWERRIPSVCCWSWRKILQLRPTIRNFIWSKLGDGGMTSAWYDRWCECGPLAGFISPRIIHAAGFSLHDSVKDVWADGSWKWPTAWRDLFPVLIQLDNMQLSPNRRDRFLWKDGEKSFDHSSACVWESIRARETEVEWVNVVWFSQCIPRHAFLMWLIMRRKLLNQDKILQWDLSRRKNMNMMCCLLCLENNDSLEHLFFECKFSTQIWLSVRDKVNMGTVEPKWTDVMNWLLARGASKSVFNYSSRLIVAASAYFIWQERNARLFKNQTRPPDIITSLILQTVRYKLMGAKNKRMEKVRRFLELWDIHDDVMLNDAG